MERFCTVFAEFGTFLYHFCKALLALQACLRHFSSKLSYYIYIYIDNFVSLLGCTNIWAINLRATNKYRDRVSVAYLVNIFMNPVVKNFFQENGVEIEKDSYALSEMVQLIFRAAIRDGNPITVYVPSKRMRELLEDWLVI